MSSRLFIARIIPLLLLLLGGFGMAVADTGGGSPKKDKVTGLAVLGVSFSNGGNSNAGRICANRQINIIPTVNAGTNAVSYTITPSVGVPTTATVTAFPFSLLYNVPPTATFDPNGLQIIARGDDGSVITQTFPLYPEAVVSAIAPPAACPGVPVAFTLSPSSGGAAISTANTPTSTGAFSASAFAAGPPATVTLTPSLVGAQSFTFTGNNADGCAFSASASSNVVAAPAVTVVASPNPVCAGQPVSFSIAGTGVTSATVSGATLGANVSPFISTTTSSPMAPSGSFVVSYTVANASGCSAVATASYTIVALPSNGPAVTLLNGTTVLGTADARPSSATILPGSFSVCQNSTVTLSLSACAVVSGGSSSSGTSTTTLVAPGYYIITTASGSVTVNNGVTSYALSTTATGTSGYEVACYNDLGCSSTAVASFTLTVLPTPVAPTLASAQGAGGSYSICQGQVFSLTASCATAGSTATITSGGSGLGTGGIYTSSATAPPGTYTYAATCQTTSCTSTATNFTLVVNPIPTNGPFVSAAYSTSAGSMTTTVDATTGLSGSAITVCQNTPLLLSVTGCTASNSATTSTNPIVVIVPGGAIGQGASVTLAGGAGTGLFLVSTSAISTTATGPYVYTIVCVNSSGCSSTAIASLSVTVNPSPGLASITAVNGTPANLAVAGGGTGAVAICQSNSPLIVTSNCLVTPGGSNTAGGSVIASSTAGVGVGVSTTATSGTFVSFSVSAATVGTFSYSFACVNSSGCPSPTPTVLTVTVNGSAVTPTSATARTVCADSGNVTFATGCGTDSATIVSRPTIEASSASIVSNGLVLGSVMSGTFVYGVQCRTTAGCSSSTVSYTLVVNPRPNNANLTIVNGTTADRNVAGGQAGAVQICQGASLTVNTNCLISSASTTPTGSNSIGGTNTGATSGTTGTDGTTAAIGGGTSSTVTPATFASFTITTSVTGITNFTFVCVNAAGCPSLSVTTLAVTVSSSVAAPTFAGTQTACLNSNALTVAPTCSTPTGASLVITGAGGVASIADINSTTATGTRSYTLQCVTPTCVSSTTTVTVIVRPRPVAPSLTPSAGGPVVASAGSGTLVVCQGATGTMPLSVTTSCVLATAATSASGTNGLGGLNPGGTGGATGTDGTTASAGGAVGTGGTSTTFASFSLGTANTGTTTYTFVCVNEFGCSSPDATTLTVVVNSSVVAPTFAGTTTACQNASPLTLATTCSTAGSSPVYTSVPGGLTATIAQVRSTATVGSFTYTVQCVTPTCVSSASTIITTIRPLPANAGLTVNSGSTTLTTVPAAGSGTVAVCQGQSLTVVTSCVINTSTASGSANVATGVSSGSVGQDGSIVAIANGVTDGTSSVTYAAFVISTSAVNTTTFTFRCQNEFGCTSPIATTLALTVSASVASPTLAGTFTACQNSGLVSSTSTTSALTSASLMAACSTAGSTLEILGASGVISMAQLLSTSATTSSTGLSYTLTCVLGPCRSLSSTTITKIVRPLPTPPSLTAVNAANGPIFVGSAQSGTVAICQQNGPLLVNTDCVLGTVANPGTGTNVIGGTSGTASAGATGTDGGTASVGGVINNPGTSNTFASFTIATTNTGTNSYTFTCVSAFGCTNPTTTTLTVTVNASVVAPAPIASVTVCQNSGVLNIPAVCSTASSSAVFTGTGAGAIASFTGSPLAVSTTTAGLQTYSVLCRTATCSSTAVTFTVFVNPQPANAAVAVTTSAGATLPIPAGGTNTITICEGTSLTGLVTGCPTTSGTTGGGGAPITGSGQVSVGGSSPVSTTSSMNTFTIPGSLTAGTYNYTVVCTSVAGSVTCTSPMATSLVVVVNGAPVSATGTYSLGGFAGSGATASAPLTTTTNITVCQNNPINLTIVGCNASTPGSNNSVPGQTSGSAVLGGSQIIGSSANNSFFTIPNTTAGVFQYTIVCTNPVTGCVSLTPITLNVTVNETPSAPLLTGNIGNGSSVTLCQGKSAIGTVTCPVNSTPSSNGSSLVSSVVTPGATANILNFTSTASMSQTGVASFSVICRSTTAGGCPSLPTTYTLTVTPIPADAGLTISPATVVGGSSVSTIAGGGGGSMTVCVNNAISVTVTGCPTTDTAASSTALSTSTSAGANFGGVQTTPGTTGVNVFSLPNAVTGTFVYTANCTNSFGCSSSAVTSLTVTVNPRPVNPVASNTVVVCETSSGVLTVQTGCGTSPGTVIAVVTGSTALTSIGGLTSTNTYTISTANIPDAGVTGTLTILCRNVATGCVSTSTSTVNITINGAPNLASLTVATPVSAGGTAVAGGGTGAITVCSGVPVLVNTNCLISTVSNSGVGNSLTAVNTGNSGNGGVVDSGTSGTSVGGGQVGGGSTSTFASFLLSTSIATTTTYTFVCVNAAGCRSLSVTTLAVTVNPTPAAPAPVAASGLFPNLVLCETTGANSPLSVTACPVGTTATVTSTLGARVITTAGSQTFAIATNGVPATGVTGSLTIVCVNSSGCPSSPYVASLTINAAPARPTGATIAAGNPAFATTSSLTICQGQPVSLTVDGCQIASGSGGGTALTGSGTGFIFTGTGFIFTPTGPTTATALVTDGNLQQGLYTFIVRCTNANGCQSLQGSSFSLVVTGQPSAIARTGFAPTCPADGAVQGTLGCSTGTLEYGYALLPNGTYANFTTSPVVLPTTAGIYSVTARCTTGGACIGALTSFTVANRLRTPAPISVQTVQNAVCLGQSTTLVAVCPTAASSAIWYLAGTNTVVSGTALGTTSIIVAPLQQGTYNYEAVCTDPAYACASARSTQIVLNVLPGVNSLPTISAQPNPTVAGAPVTLTGAGCAGTTVFYVQGSNVELGRGTGNVVSITVTPQATTTYDAVCTNGQCTSNRTTGLVVTVTPCNFVATVTPSSAVICATGGSVVLTASGGTSYVWNNGANTQQITVSAAGVYNVVVTSAQGCTALASATITTGTAPSPTITGNTAIFAGQSTTLTAGGGGLYAWNGPGLAPNAGGAAQVVSQAGTYVVTVTSPTGCTASASVVVTNIALPPAPTVTPTAAVQPNATLQACVGQTIQLVASCPIGSTPRFKIGTTTNDATTQNVTSSAPGTVIYNVVCVAGGVEGPSTFAQVVFNAVPTVQILQTGILCNNQPSSITLSATGASSYTWSTGATTQSIVVNTGATGLYSVNGANAAGCIGTATQTVSATTCGATTVLAITGATIDCVNGNITIAATGGNSNQKFYSVDGVQYSASNPVALNPAFQNNPANSVITLYVRQVNSTSNGFDVATFQFNFRAQCPVVTPPVQPTVVTPITTACGSPTNTLGGQLVVTGVTDINCLNGTFRVLVTGGTGQPIDWSVIVGLSNADPFNCTRRVDNGEQLMAINNPNSTITPFEVNGLQSGAMSTTFQFNFKAACTAGLRTVMVGSTPPPAPVTTTPPPTPTPVASANPAGCGSPANTIGQPLTITGVDQVNCAAGTFRILTTGGTGETISFAGIVGLSNNDPYNCTRTLDNPDLTRQVNNSSSTIAPFNLKAFNIGGATSNIFSFNMKQVCTGVARTARTESSANLDVTVLGNPTLGETVEVEVRGAEGQALQLRLVDGMGAAISEKSVEKAGATERQTIGLGRSAGMYFLQVTTPTKSKTVKVVRQ